MPLSRTLLVASCLALSLPALAQGTAPAAQPPAPAPAAAPSSTFQTDVVAVLGHVQKEMVGLEQAIPQAKFTWRPAKGVRSVAEVYLHAAAAGYFFARMLGVDPPPEIAAQLKTFETSTTDKAKIQKALDDSFAWFGNAVKGMSDADLSKTMDLGGRQTTRRAVVLIGLGHFQEHLGQSIAYARANGVTPPWSKKGD
jgi:uncharacterized damage-inducible protein DinB